MDLFFKDHLNSLEISYKNVIAEINNTKMYNPYCFTSDYHAVFIHIILSLIYDEKIILLDADFSTDEILNLTGQSDFSELKKELTSQIAVRNKTDLLTKISSEKPNWSLTLFTSGTTGLPKKVTHSFSSISRFVKSDALNSNSVWGFAYNPTHMAGLQVFFQALLNGNPLIRLFNLPRETVFSEIETNQITHISATPTFYRLLLPCSLQLKSIKRVTSGGEKFDTKTLEQLKSIFPNAKITNVYASTEAGSLFASNGDIFHIKPKLERFVKISEGELIIHKSLMGSLNTNTEVWYHTGDLVDIISKNPTRFRFLSRKNEMINVGGYKVNPGEVEETIRNINGIKEVRVYAKSNSVLGNIVCCEVVRTSKNLQEAEIRHFLQKKLQEFKIPRIIRFVDEIATTRTGKIKRNEP